MKLKLPFKFKGFMTKERFTENVIKRQIQLIPLRRVVMYLNQDSLKGFSSIYTNVLQAMADFDYDYLKNIMEPRLYKRCEEGLKELEQQQFSLEYVEQDVYDPEASDSEEEIVGAAATKKPEDMKGQLMKGFLGGPIGSVYHEKDMQMYVEARGAFGVDIKRSKNTHLMKAVDTTSCSFYKGKPGSKFSWRDLFAKQVLVFNVYYFTTRRLILKDEDGDVIGGSENIKERYDHKFRFETYTDKIDWVLTDIDDALKGNDFVAVQESEEDAEAEEK